MTRQSDTPRAAEPSGPPIPVIRTHGASSPTCSGPRRALGHADATGALDLAAEDHGALVVGDEAAA